MLEALLYFIVAFLVTSGLLSVLFNAGKETVTSSAKSNTTKKVEKKPKYDAEQDYQYTFRGHGVVITGCNLWNRTELRIPPMIQYMPVRDIESGAFKECKNLKKVLLPEHVAYIAPDAFVNMENLTSLFTFGLTLFNSGNLTSRKKIKKHLILQTQPFAQRRKRRSRNLQKLNCLKLCVLIIMMW